MFVYVTKTTGEGIWINANKIRYIRSEETKDIFYIEFETGSTISCVGKPKDILQQI